MKCENNKFHQSNIVMMHKKKVCKEIHVLVLHGKSCVPYETMLERIVGLTFCFNNIHEVLIKPVSMLGINSILVEEGHLLYIKN